MFISFFLFFLLFTQCTESVSVEYHLKMFEAFAKELPEFPPCDNLDWVDPNYNTFLHSIKVGYLNGLLYKIGLKDKTQTLQFLLSDILDKVLTSCPVMPSPCNSVVLSANPESKFFVWGDLHASYHSLVRDLMYLLQEGVIDEHLSIVKEDTFFVILGDAVDRGPYSIATLCLLFVMMHRNPSKVFYVKGHHESDNYWENCSLKRELKIMYEHLPYDLPKLIDKINVLFDRLPSYFLVHAATDLTSTMLFSFNGMKGPYIKNSLPLSNQAGLTHARIDFEDFYSDSSLIIPDVLFKTEEWREEHRTQNGLGLLDPIYGATTWAVLSSPIKIHQDLYNFFYDAFAVITLENSVRMSKLHVVNRHNNDQAGFAKQEAFNILTGRLLSSAQPNPQGEDLLLGSTMPFYEGLPVVARGVKHGASLAVLEQNKAGGIHGRHIRFDGRDDNYFPLSARSNVQDFIKRKIEFILVPVGSPSLKAYMDLIKKGDIAAIFPITGNKEFGDLLIKNLINLTAMHTQEIIAQIDYFTQNQVVKHFAFVFQEDEYGKETLDLAHTLLKEKGITEWLDLPYSKGAVDFTSQIEKIKKSNIDAICFLCTPIAAQEFIRKLDLEYLNSKVLLGLSTLTSSAFKSFIKKRGMRFYFSSRVPNPKTSMLPIVKEYRVLMDKDYYAYDNFSLEGYIATKLFLTVLQSLPTPITKEAVINAIEQMSNYAFEGLVFSFKPDDRSLDMSVWIDKGEDVEWTEIIDPSRIERKMHLLGDFN